MLLPFTYLCQAEGSLGWNSAEILPEIRKLYAVESEANVNGVWDDNSLFIQISLALVGR